MTQFSTTGEEAVNTPTGMEGKKKIFADSASCQDVFCEMQNVEASSDPVGPALEKFEVERWKSEGGKSEIKSSFC